MGSTGLAYPTIVEPHWLEVTHTRVPVPGPSQATVRILHLSDLHASWCVPWSLIDAAVSEGLAQKPDLVCLTGDFITDGLELDNARYVKVLQQLSAGRPAYAVLGNHDGGLWSRLRGGYWEHKFVDGLLEDAGIEVLQNRSVSCELRQGRLNVVGVGDYWSREVNAKRAFQGQKGTGTTLALCHNPDGKVLLGGYAWQLMLCGHTHGGQVMIPFEGPRYAPVRDKRYVAGLNPFDGRHIYTTRGVGNVGGVRVGCRPEVTILELPLLEA